MSISDAFRTCKIAAVSGAALCSIFSAAPAFGQGLALPSLSRPKLLSEDTKRKPPMDEPALDWITYNRDKLNRLTFLSVECLSTARDYMDQCVQDEQLRHALDVKEHDADLAQQRALVEQENREAAGLGPIEKRPPATPTVRQRPPGPEFYANRIREIRRTMGRYQQVINRENRIGATSGVVNMSVLHQAGVMIEMGREEIANTYRDYRKAGGKRPLSAL